MPFDAERWSEPRKAIATGLNDVQYAIHGGLIAIEVLRALNEPWDSLKSSTLFDYGCGTGRIAKVLSKAFGMVIGYDPSVQAVLEGERECPAFGAMTFHNVVIRNSKPSGPWDYCIAVNVFEHLAKEDQMSEWEWLVNNTRKKIAVYAHPHHNHSMPFTFNHERMHLFVVDGKAK